MLQKTNKSFVKNETISNGLKKRIDAANKAADSAEEKIKIAYSYAVEVDGLKPKEAAKILYANLTYSPQWIRKFIPDEAKSLTKSRPDQSHRKYAKSYVALSNINKALDLTPKSNTKEKIVSVPQKEVKLTAIIIPADSIKNFYNDIMRIKEKAEKQGIKIFSDATVEVLHF